MNLELSGKVAVITGGASGIGEATARAFADEGAVPVILDMDRDRTQSLVKELGKKGRPTLGISLDLRNEEACRQAIDRTMSELGRIDALVNNAGRNDNVPLGMPASRFVESLQLNLVHYYVMAGLCLPHLEVTRGNIVNVSSKVAVTGQGATSGYAAAKGAVLALTREWAVQLLKPGIRVNAVLPAEVWTPLYESWINSLPDGEQRLKKITDHIPLERRMTYPPRNCGYDRVPGFATGFPYNRAARLCRWGIYAFG
jgi:L-fucose dehydrogenase